MKYIVEVYRNGVLVEVTETTNMDFVRIAVLNAKRYGDELVINTIDELEVKND